MSTQIETIEIGNLEDLNQFASESGRNMSMGFYAHFPTKGEGWKFG